MTAGVWTWRHDARRRVVMVVTVLVVGLLAPITMRGIAEAADCDCAAEEAAVAKAEHELTDAEEKLAKAQEDLSKADQAQFDAEQAYDEGKGKVDEAQRKVDDAQSIIDDFRRHRARAERAIQKVFSVAQDLAANLVIGQAGNRAYKALVAFLNENYALARSIMQKIAARYSSFNKAGNLGSVLLLVDVADLAQKIFVGLGAAGIAALSLTILETLLPDYKKARDEIDQLNDDLQKAKADLRPLEQDLEKANEEFAKARNEKERKADDVQAAQDDLARAKADLTACQADVASNPGCDDEDEEPDDPEERGEPASSSGDPHLVTFDGLDYDFHAQGEFVLFESAVDDLEAHVRYLFGPGVEQAPISYTYALAVRFGGDVVDFDGGELGQPLLNGAEVADPTVTLASGAVLDAEADTLTLPDGSVIESGAAPGGINAKIWLSDARRGTMRGLFGDFDGEVDGDVTTRDGTVIVTPGGFADLTDEEVHEQLYGQLGPSWNLAEADSFLSGDYAPYTVPGSPAALDSFDEQAVLDATQLCLDNGWTPATGLDECVYDVLVTGDDSWADPQHQRAPRAGGADAGNTPDLDEIGITVVAGDEIAEADYSDGEIFVADLDEGEVLVIDGHGSLCRFWAVLTPPEPPNPAFREITSGSLRYCTTVTRAEPGTWIARIHPDHPGEPRLARAAIRPVDVVAADERAAGAVAPGEVAVLAVEPAGGDLVTWVADADAQCEPVTAGSLSAVGTRRTGSGTFDGTPVFQEERPVRTTAWQCSRIAGALPGLVDAMLVVSALWSDEPVPFARTPRTQALTTEASDGDAVELTLSGSLGDGPLLLVDAGVGDVITLAPVACDPQSDGTAVGVTPAAERFPYHVYSGFELPHTDFEPGGFTCHTVVVELADDDPFLADDGRALLRFVDGDPGTTASFTVAVEPGDGVGAMSVRAAGGSGPPPAGQLVTSVIGS